MKQERPTGASCPECGAPRKADNTPSCGCGSRASDALREARTAQAAAAEDFNPLRIRPYVELDGDGGRTAGTAADGTGTPAAASSAGAGDAPAAPGARDGAVPPDRTPGAVTPPDGAPRGVTPGGAVPAAVEPGDAGPQGATPHGEKPTSPTPDGVEAENAAPPAMPPQGTAPHDATPQGATPHDATPQGAPPGTTPQDPASGAEPPVNGGSARATSPREGVVRRAASWGEDPDATMTLRAVGTGGGAGAATEATSPLPTPLAPSAGPPSAQDLRLFETPVTASAPVPSGPDPADPAAGTGGRRARGRRKGVLLSAAGAVVVVMGAAGYASGLFSYEAPSRDGALPDEVRASVPDPSTGEATPSGGPRTAPAPAPGSASPSPSASASASASPSASPSPSASSASPPPSRPAEASPTPTATATEEAPREPTEEDEPDFYGGPALSRGDQGPEVVELQRRLRQLYLYMGDAHGTYDRRVEDAVRTYQWARGIRSDGLGVYGADTRRMLETETREP